MSRKLGAIHIGDKGAHYHRCDFQVHSPRDRQWKGDDCVTDEERSEYAATLIAACRGKGLDAIAVTDHHDMAFVKYVRDAAAKETDADGNGLPNRERIVVFPGIELTLAVPCQTILILDADFCIEAVEEALARHGTPEIFNTDQGSQFTSTDFIKVLAGRQIKISMDGKGAWRDNVFVERLWRTIKYEEVYLRAYVSVSETRARIGRYLTFYNSRRPHSSLDGKTPDQAYFNHPMPEAVAA